MPQLNPIVLYSTLNALQNRLYEIYIACNNIEIADAILAERNNVLSIIDQIQEILPTNGHLN